MEFLGVRKPDKPNIARQDAVVAAVSQTDTSYADVADKDRLSLKARAPIDAISACRQALLENQGVEGPGIDFPGLYGYSPYVIPKDMEAAMPATTATREDRIELRATKEEKRLLATAAAYERLDVTSFIMRNVLPTAREVVDRAERIVLSERDTVRVLELLENPPKPTPALMAAARRRAART